MTRSVLNQRLHDLAVETGREFDRVDARILGDLATNEKTNLALAINELHAGSSVSLFTATTNGTVPASGGGTVNFLRADGTWAAPPGGGGGGSGTVTTVSVVTANGVSGSVANPTTTPAITLTLGAITPSSVAASGTVTGSNLSGTNTGDQTITLTGNVTGSGTGSFATTIANSAVTLAMQADMATASVVYRKTAGSGPPEVQTLATLKTDLGLTGTNSGDQTITLTGDVTGSGTGSFATAIGANKVLDTMIRQSSGLSIIGRSANTTGNVADITGAANGVLRVSGTTLAFGAVDVSTAMITGRLPYANLTQGSARSILGVTGNSTADVASIQGTADQALVVNGAGTALSFGTVATGGITDAAVTLAKMANMATSSLIYRKTAGTGVPEVNTLATLKTDLGLTGTNSGDQTITLTGDVTGSGTGSFAATIANNAVTYAKMQDVTATSRFIGRITAGAGDPEELTGTQATTLLDAFTTSLKGLAPSSGGGTTNFLRADGTWAVPPGGGGYTPPTGTGFVHITAGAQDAAAKLVDTADINASQVTFAKIQNSSAASKLVGRGSAAGAGAFEEITLGAGLTMSSTTLSANGGVSIGLENALSMGMALN